MQNLSTVATVLVAGSV